MAQHSHSFLLKGLPPLLEEFIRSKGRHALAHNPKKCDQLPSTGSRIQITDPKARPEIIPTSPRIPESRSPSKAPYLAMIAPRMPKKRMQASNEYQIESSQSLVCIATLRAGGFITLSSLESQHHHIHKRGVQCPQIAQERGLKSIFMN